MFSSSSLSRSETSRSSISHSSNETCPKGTTETKAHNRNFSRALKSFLGKPNLWADIPTTSINPAQATALTYILSLPMDTPLLATKIAWLGSPLSRPESSLWPIELCEVHTWFEPSHLHGLTDLIVEELWDRSEGLYAFPKEYLGKQVREMLHSTLLPFRDLFKPKAGQIGPEATGKPSEAFVASRGAEKKCIACTLSLIFQNGAAVDALATLCKGRKRHRSVWPELLAFLEPVEYGRDEKWRRRWLKEGIKVRRERRRVRLWRECGTEAEVNARSNNDSEEVSVSKSSTPPNIAFIYAVVDDVHGCSSENTWSSQGYNAQVEDDFEDENDKVVTGMVGEEDESGWEKGPKINEQRAIIEEDSRPTNGEVWPARSLAYRALHGERDTVAGLRNWEQMIWEMNQQRMSR
ncbi:MAG: hypothetical protein Q9217_001284 [Psora testacea]